MISRLKGLTQSLEKRFPQRSVVFLPPDAFVTRLIDLPQEVAAGDRRGFLELALENMAPFQLDQLRWGHLHDQPTRQVCLYAASERRLRQLGFDQQDLPVFAFPAWTALLGLKTQQPLSVLLHEGSLCAINQNHSIPHLPLAVVATRLVEPGGTEPSRAEIEAAAAALVTRLGHAPGTPHRIVTIASATCNERDRITIRIAPWPIASADALSEHEFPIPVAATWDADVRPLDFLKGERNARRQSALAWKGCLAAGILICLLALGQVTLYATRIVISNKQDLVKERQPKVKEIDDQSILLDQILRATQNEAQVFAMLEAVNNQRPASIYFTKVDGESKRIVVQCSGKTVSDMNLFIDKLKALTGVTVRDQFVTSNPGSVNFNLDITFDEIPQPEKPEVKADAKDAKDAKEPATETEAEAEDDLPRTGPVDIPEEPADAPPAGDQPLLPPGESAMPHKTNAGN